MYVKPPKRRRGRPRGEGALGAATRVAILDAAEQRFADDGFEATRLQDIAADVGKTAPAVAHFFKDKTSLHNAVMERLVADFANALEAGLARKESHGVARVIAVTEVWIRFMRQRPAVLGFILRDMAAGRSHTLGPTSWTHATSPLARWVEDGVREAGTPPTADAVTNITAGPTVLFMIANATLNEAAFEAALRVHLETIARALTAILVPNKKRASQRGR